MWFSKKGGSGMTAQEMFEKFGYVKNESFIPYILYEKVKKGSRHTIVFSPKLRKYQCYFHINGVASVGRSTEISVRLHQAITQQMKELGWINE